MRRFLWQIVPNATLDEPVFIFACEFFGVGSGLGVRRAIGITFHSDRRHADYRPLGQTIFKLVILLLSFSQADAPTVIVNYDLDVIGIIEGSCSAIECGVVKLPFGRS